MQVITRWFQKLLSAAIQLYFQQECEVKWLYEITPPVSPLWGKLSGRAEENLSFEEKVILTLALLPHIEPQTLDILYLQNKKLDRPYTEFGGWKGVSHGGFLPTGETAAFIIAGNNPEKRQKVIDILNIKYWLAQEDIVHCEGQGEGEPFLSGRLIISEEVLAQLNHQTYEPVCNNLFPAKRMTTSLEWKDLILPYYLREELDDILQWIQHQQEICSQWQLNRFVKPGYRCLFYGPPGTGKTLTAALLGKQTRMPVYRVDLSMVVSKYIGETEKNLARVFDKAAHQNWILLFDEADALFGKRTENNNSNDRHANQEVAYLLQRIEDFPGMVILASNLKENIDEAFFRRFQSTLYFPMPDKELRVQLWEKIFPKEWLSENAEEYIQEAALHKLSGGNMINIIQHCAIKIHQNEHAILTKEILSQAIEREKAKTGIFIRI